jgi:hypothetical protein
MVTSAYPKRADRWLGLYAPGLMGSVPDLEFCRHQVQNKGRPSRFRRHRAILRGYLMFYYLGFAQKDDAPKHTAFLKRL